MAVIHIPEEEAVVNFRSLLKQVDAGDQIVIERSNSTIELHSLPFRGRTVAEALEILEERRNQPTSDPDFAEDIQFAVDRMRSLPFQPSPWD